MPDPILSHHSCNASQKLPFANIKFNGSDKAEKTNNIAFTIEKRTKSLDLLH